MVEMLTFSDVFALLVAC